MRTFGRGTAVAVLAIALSCVVSSVAFAEDSESAGRGPTVTEVPHAGGLPYGMLPTDLAGPARPVMPGHVAVELKIRPGHALVAVDGKPEGHVRSFSTFQSPLWLTPGMHTLAISASGYKTLTLRINPADVTDHGVRYRLHKGEGRDARSS